MKAAAANLMEAYKELNARWEACRGDWNDTKSEEFAQTYLEPLREQIRTAVNYFEELEIVARKMKQECE
jgi:uncharacterized membrane protein YgaE (UPF0421/DUF939 family)